MIPVLPHAGTRATGADAGIHPDPGFVIPAIGVDSVPMRLGLTLDGKLWIRRTDSWPASSPVIVVPRQENLAAVFPWPWWAIVKRPNSARIRSLTDGQTWLPRTTTL
jgi:hypothetical protein